jgi:hypothetical protein
MPQLVRLAGFLILVLAITLGRGVSVAQEADTSRTQEFDAQPALEAGAAWLALVDSGRYGESWDTAADTFKDAIGRVKWEVAVQEARGKIGILVRRKLRSARSAVDLPNSPPGEYVVVENQVTFDNRPLGTETVTLMKQKDGRWRVAGYFLH